MVGLVYATTGYTEAQSNDATLAEKPVEQIIEYYFGNNAPQMTAIFKAESSLNPNAINYNCLYGIRSTSCKPGDRSKAWSVDCGIAQINIKGIICPKELFNPISNLSRAKEKYDKEGLEAWVMYKNKGYEKFTH